MINPVLQEFISQIKELALESPAVERCGVICDHRLLTFDNTHEDPAHHFMIAARDVLSLRSDNFIVWHTHTLNGYEQLTAADIRMAKFTRHPVLMVRADGKHDFYDPNVTLPYDGRTWRTYHRNCYTLVQDWYRDVFGVKLPDFFLDEPDEFQGTSPSKFIAHAKEAGFVETGTLRAGDVILTTEQQGAEGWHCSLLVKTHPYNLCLSQWVDRPSGYFSFRAIANRVHSVWRYQP